MDNFNVLEPLKVWNIFSQILAVPRPSKKEDKIRKYLLDFARENNLEQIVDKKGNVVISRNAKNGRENQPAIVLQGHMDMVCEKDANVMHDFDKDPISAYVENGWVKANGTTLGADCGIGMAIMLAVLIEPNLDAPKIEALFTVDEEQGLSGAMELNQNILTGKYLINLDSEDEGEIFIGCAGGVDTIAQFDIQKQPITKEKIVKITVSGLMGGHSGDDIEKNRACANKILARTLINIEKCNFELIDIDGGNLRNAIAREAYAIVAVDKNDLQKIYQIVSQVQLEVKNEYENSDPNVKIEAAHICLKSPTAMAKQNVQNILTAIRIVPHGVVAFSQTIEGLVETSTNLASVKMVEDKVFVVTSQRSSIESAKNDIAKIVEKTFLFANAKVKHTDGYPGWSPDPNSKLVKLAEKTYTELFGQKPKIKAIHAGLECGLILQKYPKMQAISIGPTLRGVHSPFEKLEIKSVQLSWKYLIKLIEMIDK